MKLTTNYKFEGMSEESQHFHSFAQTPAHHLAMDSLLFDDFESVSRLLSKVSL